MTNCVTRIIAAIVIAFALLSQAALAQGKGLSVSAVPPEIMVPAGNSIYLKGYALGTQNYVCLPSGSSFKWTFLAPQATLFITFRAGSSQIAQQISTHFLSPNPVEGGTLRPTWQGSADTSAVWGRAVASSLDPAYVEPGAIPWLLVQAVGTQIGPTGGSLFAETTYVQRVNTSGGVAPSTGCSEPGNVGGLAFVPYTTDYLFYKAS